MWIGQHFESLYGGQFSLSTHLIKPIYLVSFWLTCNLVPRVPIFPPPEDERSWERGWLTWFSFSTDYHVPSEYRINSFIRDKVKPVTLHTKFPLAWSFDTFLWNGKQPSNLGWRPPYFQDEQTFVDSAIRTWRASTKSSFSTRSAGKTLESLSNDDGDDNSWKNGLRTVYLSIGTYLELQSKPSGLKPYSN